MTPQLDIPVLQPPGKLPVRKLSRTVFNSLVRRQWVLASLLVSISALLAALAWPMLCGRVYTADDLGAFHLPLRSFYADQLVRGEPFDWCPDLYCGFYLTGEGQVGTYHPLHVLLYRVFPL